MLERQLFEGLRPVEAPAELWGRVGQVVNLRRVVNPPADVFETRPGRLTTGRRLPACPTWILATVAAVVVMAMFWGFRPAGDEASEVRAWLATNTGLDVALAGRPGLRVVASHTAREAAEIAFLVDGREAKLFMRTAVGGGMPHVLPALDASVYSWSMRGVAFRLQCASPEDLRAACVLCHG